MKVGRPSKYDEKTKQEWIDLIQEYLESCVDKEIPLTDQQGNFKGMYIDVELPSVEGLALHLNLHKDTIYEWADMEERHEFSDAIRITKAMQAKRLLNKSMGGQYNATMSARILATNHGYVDQSKVDQTIANKEGETFKIEDVNGLDAKEVQAKLLERLNS